MSKKVNWKNKNEVNAWRRQYRRDNSERFKKQAKDYHENNKEKRKDIWSNSMFDGKKYDVLERDNWQCQECEMSQEKSIVLFNRELSVHHIDEKGVNVSTKEKNNNMDNLITMCMRCHKILHMRLAQKERFGDLLEQDDSEYRYPRIREVLNEKKKKLGTITKAKHELAKEMGMSYWTMDHMHYERKEGFLTEVEKRKRRNLNKEGSE